MIVFYFLFVGGWRFALVVLIAGMVAVEVWPGLLQHAALRLAAELQPILGPMLGIAIAVGFLRWVFKK